MKAARTQRNQQKETTESESRLLYQRRQVKRIAQRWDAKASKWDQQLERPSCHLNEDEAYSRFVREARRVIAERKVFCGQNGVIDAGCGTGLVLAEIIGAFAWGIGVDISPRMIARAKTKNIAKAEFIKGDCFDMAKLCPPAGAVISRGVLLSHYGAQAGNALLREAHEALVPGGFALFDFLNEIGRARAVHVPANKHYFTPKTAERLARGAGWERISILGEDRRRVLLLLAEKA